MAMGLVDPEWLKVDEDMASLVSRNVANLPFILAQVDRKLLSICAFKQVNLFDIPTEYVNGTGTITTSGTTVTGLGTSFSAELEEGKIILIGEDKRLVEEVVSDIECTITDALDTEVTGSIFEISSYASTIPLVEYGTYLALYYCCRSFWGSGKGVKDIYFDKMYIYRDDVAEAKTGLTRDSILGIYDPETGVPDAPESFMETIPGYL